MLLLGLVGGVALGAIAGARRTQSSYPVYLASTEPGRSSGIQRLLEPCPRVGGDPWVPPLHGSRLAALPYVESQQTVVGFDANIDQVLGAHLQVGPGAKPPSFEGAVGAEYFDRGPW